jgi:hypothetical protein
MISVTIGRITVLIAGDEKLEFEIFPIGQLPVRRGGRV